MKHSWAFGLVSCFFWVLFLLFPLAASYEGPFYDSTAYTECKLEPERALYNGGILKDEAYGVALVEGAHYTPAFLLQNLTQHIIYCFSIWVKMEGGGSSAGAAQHVRAMLRTDDETFDCIGSVSARRGCWSFLKGGFVLHSPSNLSILFFQTSKENSSSTQIGVARASLQPFTQEQWQTNQQYIINTVRKRAVTVHVADEKGDILRGAQVTVEQISKDFLIGSAIAKTILGNIPYQKWFVERFDATVFENELKWYATEPEEGKINYTIADEMMRFVRTNKLIARGHNIFWEDPLYTPGWVRNLTGDPLRRAVDGRIRSLMRRYRGEFVHWDVSNEMLHFDFYEKRLGEKASSGFFEAAREEDGLATLFLNEFNVVETCGDEKSTVDEYIGRVRELQRDGVWMDGIGLEAHFTVPNVALMRGTLDKLATLGLPIWLTELDISSRLDQHTQALYLEQVLREGFSHPSVNGIMLWTALHPNGCYQMCLTDGNLQNLPAGEVVDRMLREWRTSEVKGASDDHASLSFFGFLGEYRVTVTYGGRSVNSTFSLSPSPETKHVRLRI
ncbi:PREDICTED: uncharacterized protein LOC104807819 [Tarenaya hassleriana]|uniref:uncharacterized protein LOC104807819 n=1 Tax=Tarenaya hassleriana TaxID=28532 RepID=UPI00053C2B2E|nr:PREDICTED: uncharacterized protein LOC104807819 [Tarenaya hassleriana]